MAQTGLRGPLVFKAEGVFPFDGIPLAVAEALTRINSGVAVGGDRLYVGPQTAGTGGGWTLTETAAGAGNAQSVKQNNLGQLVLTTDNADNDLENLQFLNRGFRYSTTRKLAFFARVKVADADDGEAVLGLCITDTSLSASSPSDGIYFRKAEAATDFTAVVAKDSTETTATCGLTLADDTFVVVGFTIIGGAIRWYAFADGSDKVSDDNPLLFGAGTAIANTNAPDDEDIFLSFAVQTGAADVDSMTVDWAFAVEWDA